MPLNTAACLSRYHLPEQIDNSHSTEQLEQAYHTLCSDDDDSCGAIEEWGGGRAKVEARKREAQRLAEQYTAFLGFDIDEAQGRAMYERTAAFYAQSDSLLSCLNRLVAQFCPCHGAQHNTETVQSTAP